MIENCSNRFMDKQECIKPDSLTGMIFAMEGIRHAMVLLNGPMGCKFYHSTTSQYLTVRPMMTLPVQDNSEKKVPVDYNFLNNWFFRQPRVPCTALDGYDYVYGTAQKAEEAMNYISRHVEFELLVIINSPGASLIGDDLKTLADRILPDKNIIMLESPGFSDDFDSGYEDAALGLIRQLVPRMRRSRENTYHDGNSVPAAGENIGSISGKVESKIRKKVNILGISIWDRYAGGDRKEWIRLLELCGIDVQCCLCAENTVQELLGIPEADLNIVLNEERGLAAASFLQEEFGQPCYICPSLPVGFSATEQIVTEICKILGVSPEAFLEDSHKARALCYAKIHDIYQMYGLPADSSFAIEGSEAQRKAFRGFLADYLGMREVEKEDAELVFGDANTIAQLKLLENGSHVFCGIEINLPGMGYTDILPKTHMGITGAMFLVEQVLNGLMSKL